MFSIGDHLRTPRVGYSHHGIYVGEGRVIHYAGLSRLGVKDGPVEETSLDAFRAGHEAQVVAHPNRRYDGPASAVRARTRLGEARYGVADNNCEHFVNWCIEGDHDSRQVNSVAAVGAPSVAGAAALAAAPAVGALAAEGVFGGAAIMQGAAAIGGAVGGGAFAGVALMAAAPAVLSAAAVNVALLPDGEHLDAGERQARKAGRRAAGAAAVTGTAGVAAGVYLGGTVGVSASALTGGIAAIGGGSMALGVGVAVAGPALAAAAVGFGVYRLAKRRRR